MNRWGVISEIFATAHLDQCNEFDHFLAGLSDAVEIPLDGRIDDTNEWYEYGHALGVQLSVQAEAIR